MKKQLLKLFLMSIGLYFLCTQGIAQRQMEQLNRGVVAVRTSSSQVFVSWRLFGTDNQNTSFNLYRGTTKVNASPITGATNYIDNTSTDDTYSVSAIVNGIEQAKSPAANVWSQFYKEIPLNLPAGGTTPDGVAYTYSPNDCSVGDVDGDGEYEIIVKWDPSNSKDNSQSGYTGNVYLDAYKLNGTFLWRIDLGKNIRAGAHYTQFMVYDLDGDGKAEVVCKTAPGTKDGLGNYLTGAATGTDNTADYRNSSGYILTGPEYLTVFEGLTGKELQTINYEPIRGSVSSWGDSYGNRVDRFLACIAYLDGKTPSVVMCRGYYTRSYLVAYKWSNGELTKQWAFDSNTTGNSAYAGQGCHALCVGDIDNDGFDEIIYGACTIDHDGTGKYSTGLGHGDALHLSDFDPDHPGLEVWQAHEDGATNGGVGATFRDANTGTVLWKFNATSDVGRGMVADVTGTSRGAECWAAGSGLYSCTGTVLSTSQPVSDNFGIWWDGDDQRELLDGDKLDKYGTGRLVTLYNIDNATYCNGTKRNPNLQADILGDWREEVILHTSDNTKLIIFTTTTPTTRRLYTLMHDPIYRLGIAWQNVGYNQPPDVSFYFGEGMTDPAFPNIIYPQFISFGALQARTVLDPKFKLTATASSGLPVTYTSSNISVATISGDSVTILGPGNTTIKASQAGNSINLPASIVEQTLTVNKASQTISFADLPSKKIGDAPFSLTATSSSGLQVTYASSNTGVATINGSTVTIAGAGTTSITASQAGNDNYNAAPDVVKTLNVTNTGVGTLSAQDVILAPNPVTDELNITINAIDTKTTVEIYSMNGVQLYSRKVTDKLTSISMGDFLPGLYLVKVSTSQGILIKQIVKQ